MGTNISAQLSMVAAPGAFSLFTAYQFLSFGRFVCASESKMRPYPSCVYQCFAPTWWKWSRRAFSLLTAYQILSANFIAKGAWQSCISKLQYNTCRRRAKQFSALYCLIFLTTCLSSLSVKLTTYGGWCASSLRYQFLLSVLLHFFSAGGVIFARIYRLKTRPHDNHSVLGFNHIFDHKQNRSTRRQECTRVWKSLRKSKNG